MKTIEIPAHVTITTRKSLEENQSKEVKFKEWAENLIDYYTDGVKTMKQVRQVQKIVDALREANGTLTLEDADYDLLKGAVDAYPSKMPPIVVRQHLAFVDAIEKAQDAKR